MDPTGTSNNQNIRRCDDTESSHPGKGLDIPYTDEPDFFADGSMDFMRVMVTIPGGMETMSAKELAVKFDSEILLRNGKCHFKVPQGELGKLHQLRSVDNIYLNIADIEFNFEENNTDDKMEEALLSLSHKIDWKYVESIWKQNQPLVRDRKNKSKSRGRKPIYKVDEQDDRDSEKTNFAYATFSLDKGAEVNNLSSNDIRFRCSAKRIGKLQCITSVKCAHLFGSNIFDTAGWQFNLTEFNCHIYVFLMGKSIQVYLLLTNESLHRRNVTHYGITTLRPTICHGMLREVEIELGDIVLDPMAGSGAITFEGAICCQDRAFFIGTDLFSPAIRRCELNKGHLDDLINKLKLKRLNLDFGLMDSTDLPFRDRSIDSIVTDLPFGKRIKETMLGVNLRDLYLSAIKDLGRITRKWGVFLSQDRRSMKYAMDELCGNGRKLWRFIHCRFINHGGSRCGIYLFQKYDYFHAQQENK